MRNINDYFNLTILGVRICEVHGEYELRQFNFLGKSYVNSCPECKRIEEEKKEKEERIKLIQEEKVRSFQQVLKQASIPPAFEKVDFDSYKILYGVEQQKVFDRCKKYALEFKKAQELNVHGVFCGGVRTGKTHLAISMIKSIISQRYTAMFTYARDIIRIFRDNYRTNKKAEYEILDTYCKLDFLVIDETALGSNENEHAILFDVIKSRHDLCKPTIVISNELSKLRERMGERIIGRLLERGFLLNFSWERYKFLSKEEM